MLLFINFFFTASIPAKEILELQIPAKKFLEPQVPLIKVFR